MRFTRDWDHNRLPFHLCLLDKECWRDYREFYAPMRLYLHFMKHDDGFPVFFTIWGRRRHDRWFHKLFAEGEPVVPGGPWTRAEAEASGDEE